MEAACPDPHSLRHRSGPRQRQLSQVGRAAQEPFAAPIAQLADLLPDERPSLVDGQFGQAGLEIELQPGEVLDEGEGQDVPVLRRIVRYAGPLCSGGSASRATSVVSIGTPGDTGRCDPERLPARPCSPAARNAIARATVRRFAAR
ncbi:hypothetical protein [Kribbella sp. NPDC050459]|uniref:hypothetical protein n=1 Tax=Kribbella sp. NPDC050459 TaxID=3155785 RepID=UPI0033E56EAA